MRKLGVIVVVLGLIGALTSCVSTQSASDACLARPTQVVLGAGPKGRFPPSWYDTPDGAGIDARGTTWAITNSYPVSIQEHPPRSRNDLCMVGGFITSLHDHNTTPWTTWHGTSALTASRPNFQALQMQMHNVGDGARFTVQASNWVMRGVRMSQVHDDCIENDSMNTGVVDDSFFDGCYVFYSARRGADNPVYAGGNTFTLSNSLVRLERMPLVYDGTPGGGHGPFFKLSTGTATGSSPQMVIRNTVFRADEDPHTGKLGIPTYNHDDNPDTPGLPYLKPENCSNNTMVWLGDGPFPSTLPDCFTVTTDRAVWDNAVADWESRRP